MPRHTFPLPQYPGVCGVDEAGRGPLAGAVYAAAVILLPPGATASLTHFAGLADSKKLSAATRESLAAAIRQQAYAWALASASVDEIDRLNILQASLLAMQRAVARLHCVPQAVWVDGCHLPPGLPVPGRAVVQGDGRVAEIAAASILAKVARDEVLIELETRYPGYGFARHKGYPTAAHLAALARLGPSPVHRRSFAPVRRLLAEQEVPPQIAAA